MDFHCESESPQGTRGPAVPSRARASCCTVCTQVKEFLRVSLALCDFYCDKFMGVEVWLCPVPAGWLGVSFLASLGPVPLSRVPLGTWPHPVVPLCDLMAPTPQSPLTPLATLPSPAASAPRSLRTAGSRALECVVLETRGHGPLSPKDQHSAPPETISLFRGAPGSPAQAVGGSFRFLRKKGLSDVSGSLVLVLLRGCRPGSSRGRRADPRCAPGGWCSGRGRANGRHRASSCPG